MNKCPIYFAAVLFILIACVQLTRLILGWTVVINDITIPLWVSGVALVVTSCMAWWCLTTGRTK